MDWPPALAALVAALAFTGCMSLSSCSDNVEATGIRLPGAYAAVQPTAEEGFPGSDETEVGFEPARGTGIGNATVDGRSVPDGTVALWAVRLRSSGQWDGHVTFRPDQLEAYFLGDIPEGLLASRVSQLMQLATGGNASYVQPAVADLVATTYPTAESGYRIWRVPLSGWTFPAQDLYRAWNPAGLPTGGDSPVVAADVGDDVLQLLYSLPAKWVRHGLLEATLYIDDSADIVVESGHSNVSQPKSRGVA